jgi:uncharacterized protein with FMN-binding domain
LTLGGTAAGIAALLAVKFHPSAASTPTAGSLMPPPTSAAAPAGTAGAAGAAKPAATKPAASGTPRSTASSSSGGGTTQSSGARTFTGSVDNTQYGPMQVAATVQGKKITKITVLQMTNTGSLSQSIDQMSIPKLTQEALAAQSAKINAVSGASYTSAGYIQSLQSALDMAGI